LKTVKVPKKVITILEGESLVNDASALIVFQFAIVAVISEQFSLSEASLKFIIVVAGGVATGLLVGFVSYLIHKYFKLEPALETMLTFVTAYGAYLAGEKFHFNGVISVVSAGLFMGRQQSLVHSSIMRIQAVAVWDFVINFLSGLIFILIGLQLPHLIDSIREHNLAQLIFYGFIISVAATVIRFAYIFLADSISGRVRKALKMEPVFPSFKHTTVLAFTSMRGVVSLAAAASIPMLVANGKSFPQRDVILFITFCVVLFTLILQGLTLPWLIRILGFKNDPGDGSRHHEIRRMLLESANQKVAHIIEQEDMKHEIAKKIKDWHEQKLAHHVMHDDKAMSEQQRISDQLQIASLKARREKLHQLWDTNEADSEIFHELENELDLEEAQLSKNKNRNT
jgi:monovalent cation/hydrogen antiporter